MSISELRTSRRQEVLDEKSIFAMFLLSSSSMKTLATLLAIFGLETLGTKVDVCSFCVKVEGRRPGMSAPFG